MVNININNSKSNRHGYLTTNEEVHGNAENPRQYSEDKGKANHISLQNIFSSHPDAVVNVSDNKSAFFESIDRNIAANFLKGRGTLSGVDFVLEVEVKKQALQTAISNREGYLTANLIASPDLDRTLSNLRADLAMLDSFLADPNTLQDFINEENLENEAYNPDFPLNNVSFIYEQKGETRAEDGIDQDSKTPNIAFPNNSEATAPFVSGSGGFGSNETPMLSVGIIQEILKRY
jgi:hypothetical protein